MCVGLLGKDLFKWTYHLCLSCLSFFLSLYALSRSLFFSRFSLSYFVPFSRLTETQRLQIFSFPFTLPRSSLSKHIRWGVCLFQVFLLHELFILSLYIPPPSPLSVSLFLYFFFIAFSSLYLFHAMHFSFFFRCSFLRFQPYLSYFFLSLFHPMLMLSFRLQSVECGEWSSVIPGLCVAPLNASVADTPSQHTKNFKCTAARSDHCEDGVSLFLIKQTAFLMLESTKSPTPTVTLLNLKACAYTCIYM